MTVDANGDRLVDYTLFDMNPDTGDFEAVMIFDSLQNQFFDVPGKRMHWPYSKYDPPLDVPVCGFDGELCNEDDSSQTFLLIAALVLSLLLLILFVIFILVYRHYRLEAELASMTWKIKHDEIVTNYSGLSHMQRLGSRLSLAQV